jgi:D-arabinose 1-dehydrogenase-like Zn-dependent alcohol dehydrogenase
MAKMRAVQVSRPGAGLEMVEREVPQPGAGMVRIKVEACGVCHSDSFTVEGQWPGIEYPRIPGHEVIGTIDALGPGTGDFSPGERVGVGWHGGQDGRCEACRRGDFFACRLHLVTGITSDGGYAEYMIARAEAVARFPEGLSPVESAPLVCAGVTTFKALRTSGARPGDLVAILGIGGLGHLGVQFAAKMGFRTAAIARGKDKEELAKKLGAHHFIDSATTDPAGALQALGGAKVILITAAGGQLTATTFKGLRSGGASIVLGVGPEPIQVSSMDLIFAGRTLAGALTGDPATGDATLRFSALTGVAAMIETAPLEGAADAYAKMMAGKARFRMVLTVG